MGLWGRFRTCSSILAFFIFPFVSTSAAADPLPEGPFDYVYDIAFVNFSINGWLLLAIYLVYQRMWGGTPPISWFRYFVLFLSSVGTITFIGAMVDNAAYATYDFSVYLVATTMIGLVVAIVAVRYLRMEFKAGLCVGVIFFAVNLISWSIFDVDDVWDMAAFHTYRVWTVHISFVLILFIVSILQDGRHVDVERRYLEPWMTKVTDYQVPVGSAGHQDVSHRLVLESAVVSFACFLVMYLSYFFWDMRYY